jgi:hypothetical protein
LGNTRDHCLDRLMVTVIDLDPQSGAAARCLNLDHLKAFKHREEIAV